MQFLEVLSTITDSLKPLKMLLSALLIILALFLSTFPSKSILLREITVSAAIPSVLIPTRMLSAAITGPKPYLPMQMDVLFVMEQMQLPIVEVNNYFPLEIFFDFI